MIQRIQTLFLLLGAISAGFISMNLLGIWEHFAFAIYITGIIIILFINKDQYAENNDNTPLIISFFVGLVATILAIFSIRKDERTVQESNRLR